MLTRHARRLASLACLACLAVGTALACPAVVLLMLSACLEPSSSEE